MKGAICALHGYFNFALSPIACAVEVKLVFTPFKNEMQISIG
jgi:hypothetical protein